MFPTNQFQKTTLTSLKELNTNLGPKIIYERYNNRVVKRKNE